MQLSCEGSCFGPLCHIYLLAYALYLKVFIVS